MLSENLNRDLFKGIYGDLMEFSDRISSIVGGPVTIEDGNHRLLAYSMHDDTTDQARISTIIGRRVPEKVVNSLWKAGIIPTLLENNAPIKVDAIENVGLGNRAAVSIRKNNEVLGFIWALEGKKPFTDEDLAFLQLAAKEAKNQLQQLQLKTKHREAGTQEFLWRLLTGHYQKESEIKEHLKRFSIHLPAVCAIGVFEFPEEINGSIERNISYMLTVTQKINILLTTIDHNKLIVLAGSESDEELTISFKTFIPTFISEMKNRFEVSTIIGASGNSLNSLLDGRHSYGEALYTLKIKSIFPETEQIITYDGLGVFQSLEAIDSGHPRRREHHTLTKLARYDQKHQSDLLHTLKVYLEKDCSQNDAARHLHIHVNTLNYRLKRITEVGEVNLKDIIQKTALFLDLKLREYREYQSKS
ncbi:PucR family transcriptional regulator [Peribacillus psychrosaccharolyticus]|uniref:PucR family transcriptional regulator n=1 Tax=Peribacillus psychrosaccharolyticus TaxID=1407 RepID=A0A974S275_PERPY|nr:helix-turn-helix domain-containing protein [Peribacillus psychrosaccharolyticus]MEC2057753.1 helix-turn-helix domain-containing protein [Peribacillus psychrosaccharolyticus]MED3744717.1 helix-turn-helix domain-containing protein [Peribacillus psychrosaccharolyticus]QQT02233.1 PucR family transcriptional regulator [Peribacillus psychrosaccharolyticus]